MPCASKAELYLERARELRRRAETVSTEEIRHELRDLAGQYERLAAAAAKRHVES